MEIIKKLVSTRIDATVPREESIEKNPEGEETEEGEKGGVSRGVEVEVEEKGIIIVAEKNIPFAKHNYFRIPTKCNTSFTL